MKPFASIEASVNSPVPLRPLALLELPPELSGATGTNRAPHEKLQISARDDREAICSFLAEFETSPGTFRIYQRECERLLLWTVKECSKPLSSLTRTDFEGYLNFLADPQPNQVWCGPRATRTSEAWRPFVGPLKKEAVMTAVAAINSLFRWLCDAGYLNGNPLGLIRQGLKRSQAEASQAPTRHLDEDMWKAVMGAVEAMPRDPGANEAAYERARFLCIFLYVLAPRAGELESHTMDSFQDVRNHWWWYVTGKGRKDAKVPVTHDMARALLRYREFLGLPPRPLPQEATPLLLSVRHMVAGINYYAEARLQAPTEALRAKVTSLPLLCSAPAMTARQLNRVLKTLFEQAATRLPPELAFKADKLRAASAHWGRHTSITAKVDAGMDPRYVQKDARHEDARTTALYTHEDDVRWHEESQKLQLDWPAPPEKPT